MLAKVAIDTYFLDHLVTIQRHENIYDLICRFFQALGVSPNMHPLVYEKEIAFKQNAVSKKLFDNNLVCVPTFQEIWQGNAGGKRYYELMVAQIYNDFMGTAYPCADICADWKAQMSLGEVHTVVMCAFLLWDCFLSDDGDAQKNLSGILNNRMTHPINIYSRGNRCDSLKGKVPEDRCGLTSKELKLLGHTRC